MQLFVRTPDGLTLTPAGERAIALPEDLDERIGTIEAKVRGTDERTAGVVRIATNETFALGLLLERLLAVRERHPDIVLDVVTSMRPRTCSAATPTSPCAWPRGRSRSSRTSSCGGSGRSR